MGGTTPDAVLLVVLPALAALLPVLVWLTAERVVGPRRAPLVLTLFLAFPVWIVGLANLLAVETALVPLAAVLLLSVGGAGTRASTRRRRQGLALVLALGAVVLDTSTGGLFAAQTVLTALIAAVTRRRTPLSPSVAPHLFTVPWALVLTALLWVWLVPVNSRAATLADLLRRGWSAATDRGTALDLPAGSSIPDAGLLTAVWWLWPLAVAAGLLALVLGRARPPVRDREFLLSAAAATAVALAVVVVPPAGADSVLPAFRQALLVLAVPALLGVASWVAALGSVTGRLADAAGRRRRPDAGSSHTPPRHRARPGRVVRTALVPLVVFSVTTGLLPVATGDLPPLSAVGAARRG